ncbi:MAG: hypothetical protein IJ403_04125 [Oscillospiraceae bacterium]|nr:hypothetical protein [Oscillospiraceae bacterium]
MEHSIIDDIMYAYDLTVVSCHFQPERVYSAIENFDYYVKPGQDTQQFMKAFTDAFRSGQKSVKTMQKACGLPDHLFRYEHSLWVLTSLALVQVVKDFLDEDFLQSNLKNDVNTWSRTKQPFFTQLRKNQTLFKNYKFVRNYPKRAA